MSGQGDPPLAAEVYRGSRRCGRQLFAASFGRKPYGAAVATHGTPGDRPPAVPAVSRCRARQPHGQAGASRRVREAGKMSQRRAGTPRIVRAGPSSLNGAPHPATRDNAASLGVAASCQPVLVTFSSRAGSCPLNVAELL